MVDKYYHVDNILKTGAQWYMIFGSRSSGKSYAVKEYCINKFLKTGSKFLYVRRMKDDLTSENVESYFSDPPIYKLSKKKYRAVKAWGTNLYLLKSEGDPRSEWVQCGRYLPLSLWRRYKSNTFEEYTDIIFEEYQTDDLYLMNEVEKLEGLVSTVARGRQIQVWMIGNLDVREDPYTRSWGLAGIAVQEPGTIDIYDRDGVKIAAEFAKASASEDAKGMFFGKGRETIVSNQWKTRHFPRLPPEYNQSKCVYSVLFVKGTLKYAARLLIKDGHPPIVNVTPFTGISQPKRVVSLEIDTWTDNLILHTPKFTELTNGDKAMLYLIKLGNIAYSDDLTGTEFTRILKEVK